MLSDLIVWLSIAPVGFLFGGLMGGIGKAIGGGMRRGGGGGLLGGRNKGGGLLGGLLENRNQQQGGMQKGGGEADAPQGESGGEQGPEKQALDQGPGDPGSTQQSTKVQPVPQPTATKVGEGITENQQPAKQPTPITEGLLDPAPAAPQPKQEQTTAGKDAVTNVVNQTDEKTPVAQQAVGEEFGQTPVGKATQMADQIGKKPPKKLPRVKAPYLEANPSKKPDMPNQEYTSDQGYSYQGFQSSNDIWQNPKYS